MGLGSFGSGDPDNVNGNTAFAMGDNNKAQIA
jgi:hypothetical protein